MYIDESIINILLGFLSALLLSGLLFWLYFQKSSLQSRALQQKLFDAESRLQEAQILLHAYKAKMQEGESYKNQLKTEFSYMAQTILKKHSQTLSLENQSSLERIISPFKSHIKAFHDRIESYYTYESKERFSLSKEIQNLQKLNLRISEDATNLTKALKGDNKLQGEWGELILERVLESSGLKKGREYKLQVSYKSEKEERYRPDVTIYLPQDKQVIIDAKASLKSYEKYYHDSQHRQEHLGEFIHSLKTHIKGLSQKEYHKLKGLNSLDFVLLFIPIEGAFMLAQEHKLYEEAYRKNIILVSPSTLLAVLRVIENGWRMEYQNKNAKVIAKKAGDLYEKFEGFVQELHKVEQALNKAQLSYEEAFKKLSTGKGNLLNRAKELKALDGLRERDS